MQKETFYKRKVVVVVERDVLVVRPNFFEVVFSSSTHKPLHHSSSGPDILSILKLARNIVDYTLTVFFIFLGFFAANIIFIMLFLPRLATTYSIFARIILSFITLVRMEQIKKLSR